MTRSLVTRLEKLEASETADTSFDRLITYHRRDEADDARARAQVLDATGRPIGKNDIVVRFVSADGRKPDPDALTIDSINIRELMNRIAREGRHICDKPEAITPAK
jgi:hypothetical protein